VPKPSTSADRIRKSHQEVWQRFTALADACHEAGPLDEKTRRLVKLALAIAAGTEGGTHSAVRYAKEQGISLKKWSASLCWVLQRSDFRLQVVRWRGSMISRSS
jgi:alkylhydroperoxidase/carboxymuconolactone decarboxylase family protein YurZ